MLLKYSTHKMITPFIRHSFEQILCAKNWCNGKRPASNKIVYPVWSCVTAVHWNLPFLSVHEELFYCLSPPVSVMLSAASVKSYCLPQWMSSRECVAHYYNIIVGTTAVIKLRSAFSQLCCDIYHDNVQRCSHKSFTLSKKKNKAQSIKCLLRLIHCDINHCIVSPRTRFPIMRRNKQYFLTDK